MIEAHLLENVQTRPQCSTGVGPPGGQIFLQLTLSINPSWFSKMLRKMENSEKRGAIQAVPDNIVIYLIGVILHIHFQKWRYANEGMLHK